MAALMPLAGHRSVEARLQQGIQPEGADGGQPRQAQPEKTRLAELAKFDKARAPWLGSSLATGVYGDAYRAYTEI